MKAGIHGCSNARLKSPLGVPLLQHKVEIRMSMYMQILKHLYALSRSLKNRPQNRASLLTGLFSFFKSRALMPMTADRIALSTRLIEDMQHLTSNTEGPKLPEEVKTVLSLLMNSISFYKKSSPVQSVVQVNTNIYAPPPPPLFLPCWECCLTCS